MLENIEFITSVFPIILVIGSIQGNMCRDIGGGVGEKVEDQEK